MELGGIWKMLVISLVCLVRQTEAFTVRYVPNDAPIDNTSPRVDLNSASNWGFSGGPYSSWCIYFWIYWDSPSTTGLFYIYSYTLLYQIFADPFRTPNESHPGVSMRGYWCFIAVYTDPGIRKTKVIAKRWDLDVLVFNDYSLIRLGSSSSCKIPAAGNNLIVTFMQFKLVNVVLFTDGVTAAAITDILNNEMCFSGCTGHCSAPILTNAYCSCDANCLLCYESDTYDCATCVSKIPPVELSCEPCHSTCATCADRPSNQCQSCKSNASLPAGAVLGACSCDPGYYGKASACKACDPSCKLCSASGTTKCTECRENASLPTGSTTGACTCINGYFGSASSCQQCDENCKTCSGAGPSACTTCGTHATKNSGVCSCDTGYYPSPNAMNCLTCDGSCLTCSTTGVNGCSTCRGNAVVVTPPGPCVCPTLGFYGTIANCQPCNGTCKTCSSGTHIGCTDCFSNAELRVNPGTCNCVEGFYPNPTTASCSLCDPSCKQCSGPGVNDCTLCKPNAGQMSNPGACNCNNGYFPDTTPSNCSLCSVSCRTCTALGDSMCLDCYSHATKNAGACSCDSHYYPSPNASNCLVCDATCKACSASGPAKCTTCESHASVASPPGACVCDTGFYGNPASCQPCDNTCKACSSGTDTGCTDCFSNAEVLVSPGKCTCVTGALPNPTTATCTFCDSTCLLCSGPAINQCTSCRSNAHQNSNPGACICDDGYFPNTTSSNCSLCTETCRTCNGLGMSMCTGCLTGAELRINTCYCVEGYYAKTAQGLCGLCHPTCKSCSGSGQNQCLTCKPNSTKTSAGACACNTHYFFDVGTAQCQSCDSSCTSCLAAGSKGCTECSAPLTLRQPCKCSGGVPACARCDCSGCTSEGCAVCTPPAVVPLGSEMGECVCGDHYYPSGDACKACDSTCYSCNASVCTFCWPGATLTALGACVCKPKFFPNPSVSSCGSCHSSCPDACLGPDVKDCITQAALNFRQGAKEFGLPTTETKAGLFCYRNPVPTDSRLVKFMQETGRRSSDSSSWKFTESQCDRSLASSWSESNARFNQVFKNLQLPAYKQQQAAAMFRLWETQFGVSLLISDLDWRLLTYTLTHVQDWTTIAGFPTSYFDGSKEQRLPKSLISWISSGNKDYEVLNYWNNIPAVCFSGSCAAGDATTCCARAISCPSPCCAAFPIKQATCRSN